MVTLHARELQLIDKQGIKQQPVSSAMHVKIADAIKTADALHRLSKLPPPSAPSQYLLKAQMEMDAHLLTVAAADLNQAATAPKLGNDAAQQLKKDQTRLAELKLQPSQ